MSVIEGTRNFVRNIFGASALTSSVTTHPTPPHPNPTQPTPTQPTPTHPNPPQPNPTQPNPTPTQPNPTNTPLTSLSSSSSSDKISSFGSCISFTLFLLFCTSDTLVPPVASRTMTRYWCACRGNLPSLLCLWSVFGNTCVCVCCKQNALSNMWVVHAATACVCVCVFVSIDSETTCVVVFTPAQSPFRTGKCRRCCGVVVVVCSPGLPTWYGHCSACGVFLETPACVVCMGWVEACVLCPCVLSTFGGVLCFAPGTGGRSSSGESLHAPLISRRLCVC